MPNTLFAVGTNCPSCAAADTIARLGPDKPQVFVRLEGNPLITGTRYVAPVTRCSLCLGRFYSPVPESIKKAPKYDVSCGTTLAIGRYYLGLPMYRMEQSQSMQGIPLQDSTQWDILKKMHAVISPAFNALTELAGNGSLMIYDDTTGRILENKSKGLATHTTAFISMVNGHKVHLFLTGREVAGENTSRILSQRTSEEPVIAMRDASSHNIPKRLRYSMLGRFILCFCLVHGRRKFFEVFNFFDKECDFVLQVISQVYAHDNYCKQQKFTASERLLYHQKHSQGLMQTLYVWLNNQLLYEHAESNGGLGVAVRYMLRHWEPLTTFLRVAGAPLDSNWAERTIKIAIRHRRNSLFYRTTQGALVGDCLMSLIYTAQENHINPYDYLNALQRYPEALKANPKEWLPWNDTEALANKIQAA